MKKYDTIIKNAIETSKKGIYVLISCYSGYNNRVTEEFKSCEDAEKRIEILRNRGRAKAFYVYHNGKLIIRPLAISEYISLNY